jgi:hypothetical protein
MHEYKYGGWFKIRETRSMLKANLNNSDIRIFFILMRNISFIEYSGNILHSLFKTPSHSSSLQTNENETSLQYGSHSWKALNILKYWCCCVSSIHSIFKLQHTIYTVMVAYISYICVPSYFPKVIQVFTLFFYNYLQHLEE